MAHGVVDGLGNLNIQLYASVGALPPVRLSALVGVDDGTANGRFFIGLSVGGTPTWVELAILANVIQAVATPSNNQISSTDPTAVGLAITTYGYALIAQSLVTAVLAIQASVTPTVPVVHAERIHAAPDVSILRVTPDGATDVDLVNGYGELAMRPYGTLPSANVDHLGAIVRKIGGPDVEDTFWMCVLDATDTPIWAQFIGPTGPTGPAGPTGPEFMFGAPTAHGLGVGEAPTITETGTGTVDDPAILDFGIPVGATGAPGGFSTPALPAPGDDPVTIELPVIASGTYLPWIIPDGYGVQVTGSWGLWGAVTADNPDSIWDYLGVGTNVAGVSPHDSGITTGKIVAQIFDTAGSLQTIGGHSFFDAVTGIVVDQDSYVALTINVVSAGLASNLIAQVTVTAPVPVVSPEIIDFRTGTHGFALGYGATWVNTLGIQATSGIINVDIPFAHAAHITRVIYTFHSTADPTIAISGYISIGPTIQGNFHAGPNGPANYSLSDITGLSLDVVAGTGAPNDIGGYWPGLSANEYLESITISFDGTAYPV